MLAAVGAGLYPDLQTATEQMVQVKRVIEPNAASHAAYQPYYQLYKETYEALGMLRQGIE